MGWRRRHFLQELGVSGNLFQEKSSAGNGRRKDLDGPVHPFERDKILPKNDANQASTFLPLFWYDKDSRETVF